MLGACLLRAPCNRAADRHPRGRTQRSSRIGRRVERWCLSRGFRAVARSSRPEAGSWSIGRSGAPGCECRPSLSERPTSRTRRLSRRRSPSSMRRWMPASIWSTPATVMRRARANASWGTRSLGTDGAARCSSRRRSAFPSGTARTIAVAHDCTSSKRARRRCAGCRPITSTCTRSTARLSGRGARRDAVGAHRPRSSGQGSLHRQLDGSGVEGVGGVLIAELKGLRAIRRRAAAVQPPRPQGRERARADGMAYGLGLLPWSPGDGRPGGPLCRRRNPHRRDPVLRCAAASTPTGSAKPHRGRQHVRRLADAGVDPARLAIAWVMHQPG